MTKWPLQNNTIVRTKWQNAPYKMTKWSIQNKKTQNSTKTPRRNRHSEKRLFKTYSIHFYQHNNYIFSLMKFVSLYTTCRQSTYMVTTAAISLLHHVIRCSGIWMCQNLKWILSSGQLFWPTLLESEWCLQIPLRTFITCVMTNRGRKNLQFLSCTHSTCSSQ